MATLFKSLLLPICLLVLSINLKAQNQAIGQWRAHLPYNKVVSAATNGSKIFAASTSSFFSYDILADEISTYSKVNGMSDVELSYIAHDDVTDMTILAYTNSNIDLFKNEAFYNIPDLKLKSITSNKKIYHIYIENGMAYLSTGIGIVVLNLTKREIKETYVFSENKKTFPVISLSTNNNFFYAVTTNGLYKIAKNNPNIQASSSWKKIDSSRQYTNSATAFNKTFISTKDSLFVLQADTAHFVFRDSLYEIRHIDGVEKGLALSMFSKSKNFGKMLLLNSLYNKIDSLDSANPMQAIQSSDDIVWLADATWGLRSSVKAVIPNGPLDVAAYDILPNNGKVIVAHGSYDDRWNPSNNANGISVFENDKWKSFGIFNFPSFSKLRDASRLAVDPKDQTIYIASMLEGLFYLKTDNTGGQIKDGILDPNILDPGTYRTSGVAFDQNNNLWISQNNASNELMARSAKDGNWYRFSLPSTRPRPFYSNGAAGLIVDDYNQKWFFSPAGGGVLVYNDNNTLENISDDKYIKLVSGKGSGNLPDNLIQCIANDKKGTIWIGTNNGVGIINCPDRVTDYTCEGEIRVVQYDQFAGELFAGENVKTIAVDGANRKWIGTGNGVWLISEDANNIISRFTVDNSPLPSNVIQTIKVDPATGDVYIGTDKGLVSYKGTATDGGESNNNVVIYPNPISKNYKGTIAIKGLVDNADVRITDISGQLIFRTKALGGQAVWNGLDYTGRRPQTGVFLIFATNNLGTEKHVGKLVFVN